VLLRAVVLVVAVTRSTLQLSGETSPAVADETVPTYRASHGCVRTPLWFAPGFYSRWGVGASVYVFA
jgi:lipoprotein-anchoring transpeptidase ErfK/SrfK